MTASLDGVSAAGTQHGVVARIIKDSVTRERKDRLTTFEVRMHRFVLAEFNTHRVFSRNSASSRAIPVSKQLERVITDPAVPVVWAAEQKGMSGGDEIADTVGAYLDWEGARDAAVRFAKALAEKGVHKSITNRLLEPFMWHTVIVTASSYKNFFGLRVNPGAQPEIRTAAGIMQQLFDNSTPTLVPDGEWHLPFLQEDEIEMPPDIAVKVSAARCARVSYLTHTGIRDYEQDVQLYDKLDFRLADARFAAGARRDAVRSQLAHGRRALSLQPRRDGAASPEVRQLPRVAPASLRRRGGEEVPGVRVMPPDPRVHVGVMALVRDPNDRHRVLMLRRVGNTGHAADGHDTWSAPGGWLEYSESPERAAEREVLEETGLKVKAVEQRGFVVCHSEVRDIDIVTLFLECAYISGEPTVTEPDKCADVKWLTWLALTRRPLFAPMAAWIESYPGWVWT